MLLFLLSFMNRLNETKSDIFGTLNRNKHYFGAMIRIIVNSTLKI